MSTDADDSQQRLSQANPFESTKAKSTAPLGSDVARSRYVCYAIIAVVGCIADLWTKSAVFQWLGPPTNVQNIHWIVEGYVGIENSLNHGAVFGVGQGQVWFFATMSFVALGGVLYWVFKTDVARDWLLLVTLGLITGGILGNLYDRLGIWSGFKVFAVRDWIRLSYGTHVWPNFNIADSLLVVGAGLLIWHSFKTPQSSTTSVSPQNS